MKTYKQFITELNKFELALKAGKLGLKTLKRIQGKVNKGIRPFAHFKIGNKRKCSDRAFLFLNPDIRCNVTRYGR